MTPSDEAEAKSRTGSALKRWLPLAVLVALMALAFAMGWHKLLSFKTIGLNYEAFKSFIAEHLVISLLVYIASYVAVVALSLPGALIMTLAGGLLFGWQISAPATVIAATAGATIIFAIAKTSLGAALAAKAGPWLSKLSEGFQENALSYLLFLRLVPAFPFFVVNLAPALLGVPLGTFVLGTALGIIPGTFVFSIAGSSFGHVVEAQNAAYKQCLADNPATAATQCSYSFDPSTFVSRRFSSPLPFSVSSPSSLLP